MRDDYEPYVGDPAEPPARRRLTGWQPWIAALAVFVLLVAAGSLYFVGRGEEDPALTVPASER
jgi:hypothetical protein